MWRLAAGIEPESSSGFRQKPLSLNEEFRWQRFGLQHHSPQDFLRSQWQSKPKSPYFLTYRWLLAGFFGTGVVSYTIKYYHNGLCFIYLTNWGFILCGITSLFGAILVSVYHCKPETWVPPSCLIKTYWACYWTNLPLTCLIAITYWWTIYPNDRLPTNLARVSDLYNIWTHLLPPILFTIDHFLVAQPARLLHFVYPVAFCLSYGVFTFIYYSLGGRNINGMHYIYSFLDYKKPKIVCGTVAGLSLMMVSLCTLQYVGYRLRTFIARKWGKLQ
ncbi:protein rolling stone isoform X1 [Drosophila elegans]|uniref:protein rolling stone isoform X1 n=1 Tax=Drosophila elegans TaxID=30023 RepID=UPI0007E71CE7|nr:protein rolling stone isoform X1 [Drosophila elegans]